MLYAIKVIISALIIVVASEIAKRSSVMGAIIASLPLTSLLTIIWVYLDNRNIEQIQSLSWGILWAVIPSLTLFISLPILLKMGWRFEASLLAACGLTTISYLIFKVIISKFGIDL